MKPVKQSELFDAIGLSLGIALPEDELEEAARRRRTVKLPPLRVLLAEDSVVNQKLAIGLMEKHGHSVVVANNGKEAIAALASHRFDVVLMDVEMPEMDGLEATAVIRVKEKQTGEHIPVIAMTAHAMKGDRERCLEAGMDDYVSKPIRAQQLFDTLESVLGCATTSNLRCRESVVARDEIEWLQVLDAVGGDRDLLRTLVDDVLVEAPRLVQELRDAIEDGNTEVVRTTAHALKGCIGNFGSTPAFERALHMEKMGADENLDEARRALAALEKAMEGFLSAQTEYAKRGAQCKEL
jgi:CheY-like chemotaxis protein